MNKGIGSKWLKNIEMQKGLKWMQMLDKASRRSRKARKLDGKSEKYHLR